MLKASSRVSCRLSKMMGMLNVKFNGGETANSASRTERTTGTDERLKGSYSARLFKGVFFVKCADF